MARLNRAISCADTLGWVAGDRLVDPETIWIIPVFPPRAVLRSPIITASNRGAKYCMKYQKAPAESTWPMLFALAATPPDVVEMSLIGT